MIRPISTNYSHNTFQHNLKPVKNNLCKNNEIIQHVLPDGTVFSLSLEEIAKTIAEVLQDLHLEEKNANIIKAAKSFINSLKKDIPALSKYISDTNSIK